MTTRFHAGNEAVSRLSQGAPPFLVVFRNPEEDIEMKIGFKEREEGCQ